MSNVHPSQATLVWMHKNGRVYRRRLRRAEFTVPMNCVDFRVEMPAQPNISADTTASQ